MTSISELNLNNQQRDSAALAVNLKAVKTPAGPNGPIVYNQFGEDYIATVIPANCILAETYLVTEHAMPAGALATVSINGTEVFGAVPVDVVGAQRSAVGLGITFDGADDVIITITGGTGDITTGDITVVTRTLEWKTVNGSYVVDVPLTVYE